MSVKLKDLGKISARPTVERPTKRASDYDVAWVSGLTFRNSDAIAAVCVTGRGKDPRESGLHLTVEAARELAAQIRESAAIGLGAVEVSNRSSGREQRWQVFVDADALVVADRLAGVSGGN